jgi:hypothetical protein
MSGLIRIAHLNYVCHHGMYRVYLKHHTPERSTLANAVIQTGVAARYSRTAS